MSYNHKILIIWLGLEAATRGVLRNFAVFTVKHLCQNLFFNKVASLRPLLKKRLWYRCFSVSFAKPFFTKHLLATTPIGHHVNIQGSSFFNWIVKILEQCVSLAWSLIMKVPNFWLLMLNWSQSHTVYRRSLFYWISAKIVCFHHNVLSFNIIKRMKLRNAYTKQKCFQAKLPIFDAYQMAYSYLKGIQLPIFQ